MIQVWLHNAELASKSLPNGKRLFQAYAVMLNFAWQNEWTGVFYDSPATLFIILGEMGFSPRIVKGELKASAGTFDHSWVELDGGIYDVAVGFPGEQGHHIGPSVFASLNLDTGEPTELTYGVRTVGGLDYLEALNADSNLAQSSAAALDRSPIWDITPHVGAACGMKLYKSDLRRKYEKLTCILRGRGASV